MAAVDPYLSLRPSSPSPKSCHSAVVSNIDHAPPFGQWAEWHENSKADICSSCPGGDLCAVKRWRNVGPSMSVQGNSYRHQPHYAGGVEFRKGWMAGSRSDCPGWSCPGSESLFMLAWKIASALMGVP